MTKTCTLTRAEKILLRAVCGTATEFETSYKFDDKGRKVREPNALNPANSEDVYDVLKGKRAVDEEELLEAVGQRITSYLIRSQMVRKGKTGSLLWVTTEAARVYKLPRKANGLTIKFAEVV